MNVEISPIIDDILPLTPGQTGMLLDLLRGDAADGTLVGQLTCDLQGPVTGEQLASALESLLDRHPALRAGFLWEDLTQPIQAIHGRASLPLTKTDWQDKSADEQDRETREVLAQERRTPFDLRRPPLMRVTLARLGPDRVRLIWTLHHLVADGWSAQVLLQGLLEALSGQRTDVDQGLKAFLGWHQRRDRAPEEAFWRSYLADAAPVTPLRLGDGRKGAGHGRSTFSLPPALMEAATALAQAERITLPSLLSGIFALTLRRFSGSDDVRFGLTSAGRPAEVPSLDRSVGAYVSTLPVQTTIDPGETTRSYLARFGQAQLSRQGHAHADLRDVLEWSGLRTGRELFDAIFVYEGLPPANPSIGGLSLGPLDITAPSAEPLALAVIPGPAPEVHLYVDESRFDPEIAKAFAEDFLAFLAAAVAEPDTPIRSLALDIRQDPTDPTQSPTLSVVAEMLRRATENPGAIAVEDETSALTYEELSERSGQIAGALSARGVGPGSIVPIALPRGTGFVAAIMGVLRAGAAYVPLDLDYPKARNALILETVDPEVVIGSFDGFQCLDPNTLDAALPHPTIEPPASDLAYIIFTSGSEGRPKGVRITHGNLGYSTASRQGVYPKAPGSFLLLSSFAFDSSVVGLFWTLTAGGKLVISAPGATGDPDHLGRVIERAGVDTLLCLPGLYRTLLEGAPASLGSLETVILAGEALPPDLPDQHRTICPGARLFNEYGPTETTVWCAAFDATDHDGGPVPIGTGPSGTSLTIADSDGRALPKGLTGELLVQSPGLFAGYHGDPANTAKATAEIGGRRWYRTGDLARQDGSGSIHFLGRKDGQIKIRGFRVEMGEIEAVLAAQTGVAEAAVLAVDGPRLIAAVSGTADGASLRQALVRTLPSYMVPHSITTLEDWPRLPNGKTDRAALMAACQTATVSQSEPPRSGFVADALAPLWCDILGVEKISSEDDFFAMGGESLKAVQLMLAARKAGLHFPPHEIFLTPTFGDLVARIEALAETTDTAPDDELFTVVRPEAIGDHITMIHGSAQMCSHLATAVGNESTLAFQYSAFQQGKVPESGIDEMAEAVIDRIRRDRPTGPYLLGGYSIGAVVAVEAARRLTEQGEEVPALFLLDPSWETGFALDIPGPRLTRFIRRWQGRIRTATVSLRKWHRTVLCRLQPDDNDRRVSLVAQSYRQILLRHNPRPYDGPTVTLLSQQGVAFSEWNDWLSAACPKAHREVLDYDHLSLQVNKDALFAWTTRLVHILKDLREGR